MTSLVGRDCCSKLHPTLPPPIFAAVRKTKRDSFLIKQKKEFINIHPKYISKIHDYRNASTPASLTTLELCLSKMHDYRNQHPPQIHLLLHSIT